MTTEPRSSWTHRDRRLAPRTIWVRVLGPRDVDQRLADVARRDLLVRAAEIGEQLTVLLEELSAGRRRARRSAARAHR